MRSKRVLVLVAVLCVAFSWVGPRSSVAQTSARTLDFGISASALVFRDADDPSLPDAIYRLSFTAVAEWPLGASNDGFFFDLRGDGGGGHNGGVEVMFGEIAAAVGRRFEAWSLDAGVGVGYYDWNLYAGCKGCGDEHDKAFAGTWSLGARYRARRGAIRLGLQGTFANSIDAERRRVDMNAIGLVVSWMRSF